jgi:hypothetical protein
MELLCSVNFGKSEKKGIKNKKIKKGLKQINRDKALKQVAYLIQRSIKKKGIKPTHFFSDVVNDDLKNKIDLAKVGDSIQLKVFRNNKYVDVPVRLKKGL